MACVLTDDYAARPAAGSACRLFLPGDGVAQYRDTGLSWGCWGPLFPFTEPVNGDFSWVNQGGASVDATNGGVYLYAPAGVGNQLRIRVMSAPATPYVVTAAFLSMNVYTGATGTAHGLLWRQSSDGKLATFHLGGTANTIFSSKWTNETTFSATYAQMNMSTTALTFMRIADDGTDRYCYYSEDGQHWLELHSVGRTDFLTADQIGFFGLTQSASFGHGVTLLHWQ
jgi:hypothetical protein